MNTKEKEGRGCECTRRFPLILEVSLTVPELMYLFFFIFFLAFTTWYEGSIKKRRIMIM